jgi:hypothetical protein
MSQTAALVRWEDVSEIESLDQALSTPAEDLDSVMLSGELWTTADIGELDGWLAKAFLIYDAYTTVLSTGAKKYTQMQLDQDHEKISTWEDFCLAHLGMSNKTASSYKRVWETYVVKMNYTYLDLRRAKVGRLRVALSTLDKLWPGRHEGLELAVFGDPMRCHKCRTRVAYVNPPLACPNCGEAWKGLDPETYAAVILLVQKIKDENAPEKDVTGEIHVTHEYDADAKILRELPWWVVGEVKYPLPARVIPILEDLDVGSGLPQGQVLAYQDYVQRKFK